MPVASSPASAPRAGGPVDPFVRYADVPAAQGLYDPSRETENCGLAVIATLRGTPGHDIVQHALTALRALEHRGAVGADEGTGDGAGLLTQIPDELFRAVVDAELPPVGEYVAGTAFLLPVDGERAEAKEAVERLAEEEPDVGASDPSETGESDWQSHEYDSDAEFPNRADEVREPVNVPTSAITPSDCDL